MLSQLFADDPVLQAVLDDTDRISRTQHTPSDSVQRVQTALLIWDPGCLPLHGADSDYGSETAGAVATFKAVELGVPASEIVDDVGPMTVARLDQIAAADEHGLGREVAVVGVDGVDSDTWLSIVALAEDVGGSMLMTMGPRVMVLDGGQAVVDVVMQNFDTVVSGIVTATNQGIPADLDADTAEALVAWLATVDAAGILEQVQAYTSGVSFASLQGCGQEGAA